jgi:hypothetical protein
MRFKTYPYSPVICAFGTRVVLDISFLLSTWSA